MNFYLIGIDYKSAPIDTRESVYRQRVIISQFWFQRHSRQAASLVTCNRYEIYVATDQTEKLKISVDIFKKQFSEFLRYGYEKRGYAEVLRHLVRLGTGLISQIKGELQILQQLKAWAQQKELPKPLYDVLEKAIFLAEEIRLRAGLNSKTDNIATLVVRDILQAFPENKNLKIVIAGTGKIAELFVVYKPPRAKIYFAAHKNFIKAQKLAISASGEAVFFDKLPQLLLEADILISATTSPHIIFTHEYFSRISNLRKNKLYIYDLAIPRDVSPSVKGLSGIVLKNVDDMASLKIGTRPSPLAIKQAEEIKARLSGVTLDIVAILTKGDKDKQTPLPETEGRDFFTKEIEAALLSGRIDAAVHSAKDMEENMPKGLMIAATTKSISTHECLVSLKKETLESLPAGSVIGTSSAKRKDAIVKYRSDLKVKDIRGNIEERLRQLDNNDFDAIIVAHAALIRLGLEHRISQIIPPEVIKPHPLQGRLVIQIRKDRKELLKIFRAIDEN